MTELVRYRIPVTTIDGPIVAAGEEVEVRLLGVIRAEGLSDGMGGPTAVIRSLEVRDFAGPRPCPIDPGPEGANLREKIARIEAMHGALTAIKALKAAVDGLEELALAEEGAYAGTLREGARRTLLSIADALAPGGPPGPGEVVDSIEPTRRLRA